jgi:hypothetical protein
MEEHPLFGCFLRAVALVRAMGEKVTEVENTYCGYFTQPQHDWTIVMRKLYKTEQVLKILHDVLHFITNSLKKEKIEENASLTSIDEHLDFTDVVDRTGIRPRKDSEQTENQRYNSPVSPQFGGKLSSTRSMASLIATMRKDTGGA